MATPRRIAIVVFPDVQALDLVGPHEVFAGANLALGRRGLGYELAVVASTPGPVRSSSGLELGAQGLDAAGGELDTLLVAGGMGVDAALGDRPLVDWIRDAAARSRRVASVCSGTFLLAEAGLLDGRRVTTHWARGQQLAERYPAVSVDPEPIFVRDGPFATSAGVTAGMDLALALVEEDHGRELALTVARWLVLFLRRPGTQAQFSAQLSAQLAERDTLRDAQAWMIDHLADDLSVAALARRAHLSPRHFARLFTAEVGATPARYVEGLRLEAARRLLEETDEGVETVAAHCGFGTAETMRRTFLRVLRVSPAEYRRRFTTPRRSA